MKITVHKIGQYTNTKRWYVAQLTEFDAFNCSTAYRILHDGMLTKSEALAKKKVLDAEFSVKFKEI